MHPVVFIESAAKGVLAVNGQFCGPIEEGRAFPAGSSAEIYIQLFPFGQAAPLTVFLKLRGGEIEALLPQQHAFALLWPGGVIQLELHMDGGQEEAAGDMQAEDGVLLRYLTMRLSGDPQAQMLLLRAQDAPDLRGYELALPLRYAPGGAFANCDERAGLLRRIADNVAAVDAALARTVPAGQGIRRIERIEIVRT